MFAVTAENHLSIAQTAGDPFAARINAAQSLRAGLDRVRVQAIARSLERSPRGRTKKKATADGGHKANEGPPGGGRIMDQKSASAMPAGERAGLSSAGASATVASVVRIRPATEAAFCSAVRVTLVGSITPISTRSP